VPVLGAGCLLLTLALTGRDVEDVYLQPTARGLGTVAAQTDHELADGAYRWLAVGGPDVTATGHGLVLRLMPRGIVPHVRPADAKYYGSGRAVDGTELGSLYLTLGAGPAPVDGARQVARWSPRPAVGAATEAALADRIRKRGLAIEPAANSGQLGSLAAGFGGRGAPEGQVIDDRFVYDLGERLRDDPDALASLPDEAIIELAAQSMVDTGWMSATDLETIESIQDAYPITVWQVPIEPAG
jgi:hypothetical protein